MEKRMEAVKEIASIVLDTIEESGDQGIPSGHLYAMLTGFVGIDTYQQIISIFVATGKIENKNHLLRTIQ